MSKKEYFYHPMNPELVLESAERNQQDRSWFPFRPVVFDAQTAHQEGWVRYDELGTAIIASSEIDSLGKDARIPLSLQYSPLHPIMLDVFKRLQGVENTPLMHSGKNLQTIVFDQFTEYSEALAKKGQDGYQVASWGNYVYDPLLNRLFHIPPEDVYVPALHTSHTLFEDPKHRPVSEIWTLLQQTVVSIAGASVGGNVAEGAFRTGTAIRIADMDHAEPNTLLRQNRASMLDLVYSRAVNKTHSTKTKSTAPTKPACLGGGFS